MPKQRSPKKPPRKKKQPAFASMRDRMDAAVRDSNSIAEMLANVTGVALSTMADERLIEAMPLVERRDLAVAMAALAIDGLVNDLAPPTASASVQAEAADIAEVMLRAITHLREGMIPAMPAEARAAAAKVALEGMFVMIGASVTKS